MAPATPAGSRCCSSTSPRPWTKSIQRLPRRLLSAAVEANVRRTVRDVLESPEGRARTAEGEMKLVGAVYDLANGRVRFLD